MSFFIKNDRISRFYKTDSFLKEDYVISLIMDFGVQSLLGCVIPVLYFVFALNIKKGGN